MFVRLHPYHGLLTGVLQEGPSNSIREDRRAQQAHTPCRKRLACANAENVVYLFDALGEPQDKFKAKGNPDAGGADHGFSVACMAYSSDSTRLALGQSDGIVYVYKLGLEWRGKKSISNKFPLPAGVVAVGWRPGNDNELLFALADGSFHRGSASKNRSAEVFRHPSGSPVVSMAQVPPSTDSVNPGVFLGHADSSLYRFTFEASPSAPAGAAAICKHTCVPSSMTANSSTLLVCGSDLVLTTYNHSGRVTAVDDLVVSMPQAKDVFTIVTSPAGDTAVAASVDGFISLEFDRTLDSWHVRRFISIPNLTAVTALAWEPAGTKLVLGTLPGGICTYANSLRRARYAAPNSRNVYNFVWTSRSAIQISGPTGTFKINAQNNRDITKVDIYRSQYVVAFTGGSLLLGNLVTFKLTEVDWVASGYERFHFESDRVAMVYNLGELTVIDYESSAPLVALRTEHMSPYLVSCVLGERRQGAQLESVSILAYLVDMQTVRVMDMMTKTGPQVSHEHSIDWLELNHRGSHLLFRDSKCQLHLYSLATRTRKQLLQYVSYVQWVPDSDVIVAQSRRNLCVWYSIHKTEQPFIFEIEGQVQDIEKSAHATEVLVLEDPLAEDDGIVGYQLDDNLVCFAAAMESGSYEEAMQVLDPLERTPDTEAQWQQLCDATLATLASAEPGRMLSLLTVAERCCAAIGNIARGAFLRQVSAMFEKGISGDNIALVRAEAALDRLLQKPANAEQRLLQAGLVDDAISAHLDCQRWQDAIRVAEETHHLDQDKLKKEYMDHLLATKQLEQAGKVKESEGDVQTAILHYINGGLPALAAQSIIRHRWGARLSSDVLETLLTKLGSSAQQDAAGELLEHLQRYDEALESFRAAHNYSRAVQLASARPDLGGLVVSLQEEWGEHLVSTGQTDNAVSHFIEAGATAKAAKAALAAKNLPRAGSLIELLHGDEQEALSGELAALYQASKQLSAAAKYYVIAGRATAAVHMYFDANLWDEANKTAVQYLEDEEQMHKLYWQRAQAYRAAQQYPQAERTLLAIRRWDAAAEMYKAAAMYTDYLRLMKQSPDNLASAQLWVAQQLEAEGHQREAEEHYCAASQWKSAVKMYRKSGLWEDVVRVAKTHGGVAASKQVAYAWAMHLEVEEKKSPATRLSILGKMGLVDYAIDYAAESGDFENAFTLAEAAKSTTKLPEIHLKHAMHLEDNGQFSAAEAAFLKAKKPREAIEMYCHQQMWEAALRVAESHDAASSSSILRQQADALAAEGSLADAEQIYVQAHAPDQAIRAYRQRGMWDDALRVARHWRPELVHELQSARSASRSGLGGGATNSGSIEAQLQRAKNLERQGSYQAAVDAYLAIVPSEAKDTQKLAPAWQAAVRLAAQHLPSSAREVAIQAAQNLASANLPEAAAALLSSTGNKREAVTMYCQAGLIGKARALASGDQSLEDLMTQLDASLMVDGAQRNDNSSCVAELDELAHRGNWDQVHSRASTHGKDVAGHYLLKDIERQVAHSYLADAASLLSQHAADAPITAAALQLYTRLAAAILRLPEAHRSSQCESDMQSALVSVYSRTRSLEKPSSDPTPVDVLQKCMNALTYLAVLSRAEQNGWQEMAAKAATSLLRFLEPVQVGPSEIILMPADKALYLAGCAWRKVPQHHNDAFVFLNAFLDISEAIEDGNTAALDLSDLKDSRIFLDFSLPSQDTVYSVKGVERVKEWVLDAAMQQNISQEVSKRTCVNCGTSMFAGLLECPHCYKAADSCSMTGWPIPVGERIEIGTTFKLILAPMFALGTLYLVPFSLGITLALLHWFSSDGLPVSVAVMVCTVFTGFLTAAASAWMRNKWQVRKDMEEKVWSGRAEGSLLQCCFSGEKITHRCPRCSTLINQCCMLEEMTSKWVPIVHETDRSKFYHSLDSSLPGMAGRMYLDESLELRADWTRLKSSMCCIACVADVRCCQIMPVLTVAISCMSIAAGTVPFALNNLPDEDYLRWIPSAAILVAMSSALSTLPMLLSAYCTLVVFTDLHRGIKWSENNLCTPTAWHRWWARPDYLVELPLEEDEEASDDVEDDIVVQNNTDSARAHRAS